MTLELCSTVYKDARAGLMLGLHCPFSETISGRGSSLLDCLSVRIGIGAEMEDV